jgi:biopolymer transport protein ExbD
MRHSHHSAPQVNAGSMADIAFLLLIFFLVTTTISADQGINRKLPANCPLGVDCTSKINERNIFRIILNANNQIMIENELVSIDEVKDLTKAFIDNNGDKSCSYCNGKGLTLLSDAPKNAVISLQTSENSNYALFIAVQDELTKAYSELREVYCYSVLGKSPNNLTDSELSMVKKAYPFIISEADTK